jgi:hypothetical protein
MSPAQEYQEGQESIERKKNCRPQHMLLKEPFPGRVCQIHETRSTVVPAQLHLSDVPFFYYRLICFSLILFRAI